MLFRSEKYLQDGSIELPVQINGKVRAVIGVAADASEQSIITTALSNEKVKAYLAEGKIMKQFVIPKRMVSFVIQTGQDKR